MKLFGLQRQNTPQNTSLNIQISLITTQKNTYNHLNQWRFGSLINFSWEQVCDGYATSNRSLEAGFWVNRARTVRVMPDHEPTSSCRDILTLSKCVSLTTIYAPLNVKTSADFCATALFELRGQTCVWMQREFTANVCDNSWVEGKPRGGFK